VAHTAGVVDLGANTILGNVVNFAYRFPLGLSIASSTLTGNMLGSGDADGARRVAAAALTAGVTLAVVYASALALLRYQIPRVSGDGIESCAKGSVMLPSLRPAGADILAQHRGDRSHGGDDGAARRVLGAGRGTARGAGCSSRRRQAGV
jgi:hypothetical protein